MNIKEIINHPKATLIDVRTPGEYAAGNVPNSKNIPLNEVQDRLDEFKNMQKPVVVFCLSGGRSGQAAAFLKANGVIDVHNGGGWESVKQALS